MLGKLIWASKGTTFFTAFISANHGIFSLEESATPNIELSEKQSVAPPDAPTGKTSDFTPELSTRITSEIKSGETSIVNIFSTSIMLYVYQSRGWS